jgi:flagellar M-ring protein FliF
MATAARTVAPGIPTPTPTELTPNAPMTPSTDGEALTVPIAGGPPMLPATGVLSTLGPMGNFLQQPAVKKATPAIIVLLVFALIAGLYLMMQEPNYRSVFPGMQEADQQAAMEALKAANFAPRLDANSGQLMVPANRYHEARMLLASQGLPRAQGRGILDTLKDQTALTTSQFMEQARYSAAIEQELAKSVMQIATIQSARVHLAQTRQSPFARDRSPVKASVVVTPHLGRSVATSQVQAIVHLVASSVPYLAVDDVSVVDNAGTLLTKPPVEGALGLTSMQAQHRLQSEEIYRSRIIQLLEPIVGEGNVRAQVDLVMDFSQVETATEDFDPRQGGAKTRSESMSEERNNQAGPQGVPGALANIPPPPPANTADTTTTGTNTSAQQSNGAVSSKSTRNYEIDKTIRHVKAAQGGITRVSAAVVIKERNVAQKEGADAAAGAAYTPEELERMVGLVKGVVGFREDRGDAVSLMPAKFELSTGAVLPAPWWENEMVLNGAKLGIIVLLMILALVFVVRPALKAYAPAPVVTQATLRAPAGDGLSSEETPGVAMNMEEGESLEEFKARLKKAAGTKKGGISADMLDTANTYDDKVALVRMLVQEDSARVANVLKGMIKRDMKI